METEIPGICVPMVADCSIGNNWGEQVELGNRPTREAIAAALESLEEAAGHVQQDDTFDLRVELETEIEEELEDLA
jgi:hypothetical protein